MRLIVTRDRLLDAAEKLFAEYGIEATSLRQITAEAEANIAAVNYYFSSKESLVQAALARRFVPLNQERLRRLDEVEKRGAPTLEEILHAFLAPTIQVASEHPYFLRFAGRLHIEANEERRAYFLGLFEEIIRRFGTALSRALPQLPMDELFWRMHFFVGAMINSWLCGADVVKMSGGICKPQTGDQFVRRLVTFGAAGLRAEVR